VLLFHVLTEDTNNTPITIYSAKNILIYYLQILLRYTLVLSSKKFEGMEWDYSLRCASLNDSPATLLILNT